MKVMKNRKSQMSRTILLACVGLLLIAANSQAATLTVTKIQDTDDGVCDVDCSLREAVDVAASGDTIEFSLLFDTPQTITLTVSSVSGLRIDAGISIIGPGANLLTVAQSNGNSEVFYVTADSAEISGMTITGGMAAGIRNTGLLTVTSCTISGNSGIFAGGIDNRGDLTLENSTVSENVAYHGPALFLLVASGGINTGIGQLTVLNSTISGNLARCLNFSGCAGGIGGEAFTITGQVPITAEITITNSTVTNNFALGPAGNAASGIFTFGNVELANTIIAANVNNSLIPDIVSGSTSSNGYNLVGNDAGTTIAQLGDQIGNSAFPLDPLLDPLGDYGGMTQTHRLQTGSPAIDKGFSFGSITDQRGFLRPFNNASIPAATGGDESDIGAYELQTLVFLTGKVLNPNGAGIRNIRVLIRGANGERRAAKTDREGFYRFENIPTNRTYMVGVKSGRYDFTPRILNVFEENVSNFDFIALP